MAPDFCQSFPEQGRRESISGHGRVSTTHLSPLQTCFSLLFGFLYIVFTEKTCPDPPKAGPRHFQPSAKSYLYCISTNGRCKVVCITTSREFSFVSQHFLLLRQLNTRAVTGPRKVCETRKQKMKPYPTSPSKARTME